MRFLVSGAGGDIGQSIANIINSYYSSVEVFGSDIHDEFLLGDVFREVKTLPPVSSPLYLECLSDFLECNDIDIFIPTSEPELRWLVGSKVDPKDIPCKCIVPNAKAMQIGFDKFLTYQHLSANSIPAPWASLASMSGAPEIPCILKSRAGAGNSSVYFIDNLEKSLLLQKIYPDYMWQQFLPLSEGEYTCGVYRCQNGETRVIAMKRRLASGVTTYAKVVNIPVISTLCVRIAESLDLFGGINIQLRMLEGLGPMVFEINPRFSSTVGMRHWVGFKDLIWSIEEQFLNQAPSSCPVVWPDAELGRRYFENCKYL